MYTLIISMRAGGLKTKNTEKGVLSMMTRVIMKGILKMANLKEKEFIAKKMELDTKENSEMV